MNFIEYKYKDIGNIRSGKRLKKGYTVSETKSNNKYIRVRDINNGIIDVNNVQYISDEAASYITKYRVSRNDIIISVVGTVGSVASIPKELEGAYLTENCNNLLVDEKICLKEYLKYYLLSKYGQAEIVSHIVGTTQPKLPIYGIEDFTIKVPEKECQSKIIKILNIINSKITLNTHINNNLYEICNTIYHDYINKYSDLIEYKKIIDIADRVITGKTPSTKNDEYWNGNIPFITIPDMHNQVFTLKTERNISKLGAKAIIPKNSISVSCIATVGLVSISTKDSQTNQQINSIVLKNDYDLYYLFEYFSEQENYLKSIAGGSTTYNINKNTFENIEIPYLPQEQIIEFNNSVCNLFKIIKLKQEENIKLEQLRDTLLPKLMNGEIDLDKVEI